MGAGGPGVATRAHQVVEFARALAGGPDVAAALSAWAAVTQPRAEELDDLGRALGQAFEQVTVAATVRRFRG